jgi:hypothetical protein
VLSICRLLITFWHSGSMARRNVVVVLIARDALVDPAVVTRTLTGRGQRDGL